jgi:hypothetical protein
MKLTKSPYTFVVKEDGSINFDFRITGEIPAEHVEEVMGDLQKRLKARMRYDTNAIQLDDFIAAMPKKSSDDFIAASLMAIVNAKKQKEA